MALVMGASSARSPRVVYASALGCKLDVDFATGRTPSGAPATDNTGALNAFLATASASNPVKLILDGPALVRGLVIAAPGYTTIEGLGWGTGIYLADGANQDAIRIGAYTGGQTEGQGVHPVPLRSARAVILRDFAIFGNGARVATGARYNVTPPNVPMAGAPAHAVFGVAFASCHNVLLDHLRIIGAACYAVMLANVADVSVVNCSFESTRTYQDGVHIDGPAERISIHGCRFATGDDAIAVNAPEGFGGDIEDVHVSNCFVAQAYTLMRVYTSTRDAPPVRRVRRIVVAQCTGTTTNPCFNLGIEGNAALLDSDQIEDMLITGCSLAGPGLATLRTPIGSLNFQNCVYRQSATAAPAIEVLSSTRQMLLDNCTLLRDPAGSLPSALVAVDSPGFLAKLVLAGVRVVDEERIFPPLPFLLNPQAPVHRLEIEAADMDHVGGLVEPEKGFSTIGSVGGSGVLGTGVPVPEAKIAENVLFKSAETGKLSVKVQGAVQRLS